MNIQEEIKKLKAQQSSVKKAKVYLKDIEARINWIKKKISKFELHLNLKFDELERLQKLKVKKLFSKILIDKETQLEEKRQEYLEKFLEYKESKKSLDFLLYEQKIVIDKIKTGKDIEARLKTLMQAREANYLKTKSKDSHGIIEIQVQIDKCKLLNREFYEALIEGARTKKHIATITNNLNQAKTMRIFTFANREEFWPEEKEHVDKAMEAYFILKPILRKFELELEDIYKNHGLSLEISLDTLTGFTKNYYYYLINDWIVYEKINIAVKNMLELESNILDIIHKLEEEQKKNLELVKDLEEKKRVLFDQM